jgi:uncharacterized protein YndB with AHSA1/START domain
MKNPNNESIVNDTPVIVERTYNAPVSKVWTAITDKIEMKKWYFDLSDFKAEPGFRFQFKGGREDGIQYLHLCEVLDVVKEKKLSYSWRYDGYAGNSTVTFELFDETNRTRVRLTHDGLNTFPSDNSDLDPKNFVEGWNSILGENLKNYLENKKDH